MPSVPTPRPNAAPPHLARTCTLLALVLLGSASAHAETLTPEPVPAYETEPSYSADQLLEPALLSGPGWKVDSVVPVRGYLAQFHVVTGLGELLVEGRAEMPERVHELAVVEQLAAISRGEAFAQAVGKAGREVAQLIGRLGTHPIRTVTGIPRGLMRSLRSKWRDLREQSAKARDRAAAQLAQDDAPRIGPQAPADAQANTDWWTSSQRGTGKLAKRWLGFTQARRELARRFGVDPYSRNVLLNRELDRIAWASLAGEKSLGAAIDAAAPGVSEAVGWSERIDDVVWRLDPVALGLQQRERLAGHCGEAEAIARAMHVGAPTPSQWQRLVDAVEALRVHECHDLIALLGATRSDAEARYLVRALELLATHRGAGSQVQLGRAGNMLVARIDGVLVVPMPVDALSWTEPVANLFDDPALRAAERELWLDGEATMRTQRELTRRGFGLRIDLPQRVAAPLPTQPAP